MKQLEDGAGAGVAAESAGEAGGAAWAEARRLVVKIGSALLVDHASGRVRSTWLNSLADDVAQLRSEGRLVDADGLDPDGKVLKSGGVVLDGPFAETKEVVGGYYVYNASDWDEAVALAKECPTLEYGGQIELRKVMDYS